MTKQANLIALICFAVLALAGSFWTHTGQQLAENEQRLLLSQAVSGQASAIERRLSLSLNATYILAQEVIHNRGTFPDFDDYAQEVLQSTGGISNLQLAPGGIISRIYPLAGNEAAIGHNILRDDRRKQEALDAIKHRHLTLAGPFTLIQGGVAIIGRNPVFLDEGTEHERFWGFTSALIFLDDLLRDSDLSTLEQRGYRFQLSRTHPDTGKPTLIASSATPLGKTHQSATIKVPNGEWHLTLSHPNSNTQWIELFGYAISFMVASLTASALRFMLLQPQRLQREVEKQTRELQHIAFHDPLTGLPNRRHLHEQLDQLVQRCKRYNTEAALLYLDLDDFKRINDLSGHSQGDQFLQQLSNRMQTALRESDFLARLGGDEFALLVPQLQSRQELAHIAEKLIACIEQPVSIESRELSVSASIGITLIPSDGDQAAPLLRNADMAMYAAKGQGKHRFSFFNTEMQRDVLRRIRLEEELREAISQQQFALFYQPLVCLKSLTVCGYEALIRWHHPRKGLLFPDAFIGIAEETGLIRDIGYWVIAEACRTLRQRQINNEPAVFIAVNLSPQQFSDKRLAEVIRNTLQSSGVAPSLLEIEITETSIMKNLDDTLDILRELKKTGLSVAIDDFGTGYSSLAMLKRLPVDKIKIDRSFIQGIDGDRVDRRIVSGLIKMMHTLNRVVVAEGIETEAHLKLLRNYGCDYGQGYLFSKPVPLEAMNQLPQHCVAADA